MGRSARRKSAPSSPAKPRAAATSPRQTRRSKQASGEDSGNAAHDPVTYQSQRLQAIDENEDTITVKSPARPKRGANTTENASDNLDEAEESSETAESVSQSSDSDEIAKLDKDLIIDNLEAINQDALNLISLFKSSKISNVSNEISDPSSTRSKRFKNFLRRLQTDIEPCGRGPRIFLPVSRLLRVLTEHDLTARSAEPILLRANLAIFTSALMSARLGAENDQSSDLLQYFTLPTMFPYSFFGEHEDVYSFEDAFGVATLKLGISILTQLFVENAEKSQADADFDPEILLQTIFLDEDGDPREMSLRSDSPEAVQNLRESIEQRMLQIQKHFQQKASRPVDIPALRRKFEWKSFVEQSIMWVLLRDEQINKEISEYGGAEVIRSGLEAILGGSKTRPQKPREMSERERDEKALKEGTNFLRELGEQLDAADEEEDEGSESDLASESQRHEDSGQLHAGQAETLVAQHQAKRRHLHRETIPESPQAQNQEADILEEQRDDQDVNQHVTSNPHDGSQAEQSVPDSAQAPRPTQETLDVLGVTQRQDRESNKENNPPRRRFGLTDRQPNAERLNFDDEPQRNSPNQAKRRREEVVGSEDEDQFETDTRQAKKPRPFTGTGSTSSRVQQEKPNSSFFVNDSDSLDGQLNQRRPTSKKLTVANRRSRTPSVRPESSSARTRGNLGNKNSAVAFNVSPQRSVSHTAPPASSYEEYVEVKQRAQENLRIASLVAASSSAGQVFRPTQVRRAWSADEIRRLMDLMSEYGTSWAKIKDADSNFAVPLLENRSQVQLKDKARNMKLDFLKAEQPLPDYFDGVTISKSHKDQLRRMNIGLPRDIVEEVGTS